MGIWGSIGNAFMEAGKGALISAAITSELGKMNDQSLIDAFDQMEDKLSEFDYMSDEEKRGDEDYKLCVRSKSAIEAALKQRGYRPKTIYVKED